MNTLTATYRVVTPMFLGGAEPTAEAELRLPSFKGALRFWWRAIMWGKVKDVDELRRREAELFGSSENGQSRLILSMEKVRTFEDRPAGQWRANSWEQYTGYGLRDEVKGDRRFIPPGTTWVVRVRLRDYEPRHMDQVVAAMKLVGLVGGLGARSRNAWGSLTLLELEGRAVWKAPQDPSTLVSELEGILRTTSVRPQSPKGTRPDWTAVSSDARFGVGGVFSSATLAHERLGKAYKRHVQNLPKDSTRWQFGIPRHSEQHHALDNEDRRAKPLFLHVHEALEGCAIPVALYLPARFLAEEPGIPDGGKSAAGFITVVRNLKP